MKQAFRFVFQPGLFFNQLQWSRAHWFILFAFLTMGAIETFTGDYSELYLAISTWLGQFVGISIAKSVWAVTAVKLALMLATVYFLSYVLWHVGRFIGDSGSLRVLTRRLSIVLTVLLFAETLEHVSFHYAWLHYVSMALVLWGAFLGYYAIREQFSLTSLEALLVAGLAALILSASIQIGDRAVHHITASYGKAAPSGIAKESRPSWKENIPFGF